MQLKPILGCEFYTVDVSIPQAVRGCMQLCVPEPLWDKPSKWGFGQETSFSIVFAISEHGHRFKFLQKIGSSPSPIGLFDVHGQIGQVLCVDKVFLLFHTIIRRSYYTGN